MIRIERRCRATDELRLGGTASATASSGSINIITTSTSRKLKCDWASSLWWGRWRRRRSRAPQLMEVELVGLIAAAAAELVDHRQADRQIVDCRRRGCAGVANLGESCTSRPLVSRNRMVSGSSVEGTGRARRSPRRSSLCCRPSARKCRGAACPYSRCGRCAGSGGWPSLLNSPTLIAAPSAPDFKSKRRPS